MPGPTFIEGERVSLHPVEEEDAEFFQRVVNDPDVRQSIGRVEPINRRQEEEYLESLDDTDGVQFVVVADDDRVGTVSLMDVTATFGNGEIGYFFAPESWGNGYATEATELVVDYAFAERRLHKVYAHVFAFNDASRHVLEKNGFEREGTQREQVYVDGEYVDVYRYGLLEDEWAGRS